MNENLDPGVNEVSEYLTHTFVVKVWSEELHTEAGTILWRGHVTHVSSGSRRYFQQLGDVLRFIDSFLAV
jgi:hypothetical protein